VIVGPVKMRDFATMLLMDYIAIGPIMKESTYPQNLFATILKIVRQGKMRIIVMLTK
jgi:hypothetical protein